MKISHTTLAACAAASLCAMPAYAALSVTNGGFGTNNRNGGVVDGGGWFESGTTNWVDGSWSSASNPNPEDNNDKILLLFDGGNASEIGYVYQSLGTVTQAEIDLGVLQVTSDFAEKADGSTNTAVFDFYVGAFPGAATGTDIDANLTSQLTINVDAAAQGLTAARGDASRQNGVNVGTFDLSGLTAGDEVWMRISEIRLANDSNPHPDSLLEGDLMLDNVAVTVVPEPSSTMLLGFLGGLGLFLRRRK